MPVGNFKIEIIQIIKTIDKTTLGIINLQIIIDSVYTIYDEMKKYKAINLSCIQQ